MIHVGNRGLKPAHLAAVVMVWSAWACSGPKPSRAIPLRAQPEAAAEKEAPARPPDDPTSHPLVPHPIVTAEVYCDVWGGDGDHAPLVRFLVVSFHVQNRSDWPIEVTSAQWSLTVGTTTEFGTFDELPEEIPAGSAALMEDRSPLSAQRAKAFDESGELPSGVPVRTANLTISGRAAGGPIKTEKVIASYTWRSCFASRDEPAR